MISDQRSMELQSLYKHGTHILTEQRRGPLLSAGKQIAFLEQKKKIQIYEMNISLATSRPNMKLCGGGSACKNYVSPQI
jgi:hypothetical protein